LPPAAGQGELSASAQFRNQRCSGPTMPQCRRPRGQEGSGDGPGGEIAEPAATAAIALL